MAVKTSPETRLRLQIEYLAPSTLRPDERNARRHPKKQIAKLRRTIREIAFTNPILVDEGLTIIAGHARLEAAILEKLETVPCVRIPGLSPEEKIALAIADNKLGDLSYFDDDQLGAALRVLEAAEFDVELTGFDTGEIDRMLLSAFGGLDPADTPLSVEIDKPAVSHLGDLWILSAHRLYCGDARSSVSYEFLLGAERAQFVMGDSPYNVPILGHVSGLGKNKHREFAAASGEMSKPDFTNFLATIMKLCAQYSIDGSLHALFMDWRHMDEILEAGRAAYNSLQALCVWDKQTAGMGSMWRSQHELVFVFKNGNAPHQNNIALGVHGRNRSNVWSCPGLAGFGKGRDEALAAHPTVKPVSLVADAIRDCTKRGGLVLDPFSGSGTTIIAAERTNRRAAAIEIDPLYVDVAVRRWQGITGKAATLATTGQSFEEVAAERQEVRP